MESLDTLNPKAFPGNSKIQEKGRDNKVKDALVLKYVLSFILIFLSYVKIDAQIIATYAGSGTSGYSGDGGQATAAEMNASRGVVFDAFGNLYIASGGNNRIRKVNTSGIISTFAGNGAGGSAGDGGQATAAEINTPYDVTTDAAGNVYIVETNGYRIRKVNTSGIISTVAGNGHNGYTGDGGQATAAEIDEPLGVAVDASGNVYIAILGTRVRLVNTSGVISTLAGNGTAGFSGDGGQATAAEINQIYGLCLDASGNVYIADVNNRRVRKVNTSGVISTFAGNGNAGNAGNGGQATAAEVYAPTGLKADASGNIYITDELEARVRKVNTSGVISAVAGVNNEGYSGDGGQATVAELNNPYKIAFDNSGNLYIGDEANNRVRVVYLTVGVSTSVTANISCNGGSNGSATATASNGTTPYTYSWSGGQTTTSVTGLSAGTYTVTVTDHNGETGSATAAITQPATLSISAGVTANVSCNGGANGSVSSTPSGGTSPYTYSWTGGGTASAYTGLSIGTYTVTVTDNKGCTATAFATITQPGVIKDTITSITYLPCGAGANATIGVTGGTIPYTYLWSPSGKTTAAVTGLSWGTYTVSVSDAMGCSSVLPIAINQPVNWTDTTGVSLSGYTLSKYAATNWGNGGAASENILLAGQNGCVKVALLGISGKVAFGLTSINVSADYRTFDFAMLVHNHHIYIYERGVLKVIAGMGTIGDTLKIQRIGTTIFYKRNSIILYTSTPPSGYVAPAGYTRNLEVVASLYDRYSSISGVTCNFSQNMFVHANVSPQFAPDSLGSTVLTTTSCHFPNQYIWNGARYPFRNQFRPFLDSIMTVDSLHMDTTEIFHQMDSLRQDYMDYNEISGIQRTTIIDSVLDSTSINSNVGERILWVSNSGLSANKINSPRFVGYLPQDSLSNLIEGQPDLSQPVTCYSDSGWMLYKTASTGWSSGEATSVNSLAYNAYGKVSFVIPDNKSVEAAGLKIDSVTDIPGYADILYGFYFQRGRFYIVSNGSYAYMGVYNAGDMFSIENTYDSTHHLQRILYKRENKLVRISYISRSGISGGVGGGMVGGGVGLGMPRIRYVFKASIHTQNAIIISIHIIGWWIGPFITANIQQASCGYPTQGAISLNISFLPPGYYVSNYAWSNGATTSSITNVIPGIYSVTVTYTNGSLSYSVLCGPYVVGYKIYWATLQNAKTYTNNTNTIYEVPPGAYSIGNSSNAINYKWPPPSGQSFIQCDAGNARTAPISALRFGYTNDYNPNTGTIDIGLFLMPWAGGVLAMGIGFSYIRVKNGYATNAFMVSNSNFFLSGKIYFNGVFDYTYNRYTFQNSYYIVKSTLQGFTSATLYNGLCSFGCPDMNFSYATLTKTLDGSYYISPYGNLSFKFDEEYAGANNGNLNGLQYVIYDPQHGIMGSGQLSADNYKDNYYSIDLTAVNSAIRNGYFILQITNKKGEVTELRFKN